MRVSDIFLEVKDILGYGDEARIFSRLSDAVETLSNKGLPDILQGYLEIPVTSSRTVTLPRDVEVPIKVNVGDNPSFSRTKLYEFSMNGPGSSYAPTDWAWEDKGGVPTATPMVNDSAVKTISNSADNGKKVYVWGRDANNKEIAGTLTLNGAIQPQALDVNDPFVVLSFMSITRVVKDPTLFSVTLVSVSDVLTLSVYAPDETEPSYRQIKITQAGKSCHILFRRTVYRVSSQNDWIPIQSRMGLFLMLRANEFFRKATAADIQTGQALEKQAEQFVNEEQKSRNVFAEVAAQTEKDSAKGLYFTNRDCIIVADIYDEAAEIVGPIGEPRVFDRITESIEALSNKAQWDSMTLYLDTGAVAGNVIVLPREVEIPIKVNINENPSFSRDRLYEFTLNGPGPDMLESTDFAWMDGGNVPIVAALNAPTKLRAWSTSALDNTGHYLTVYGKNTDGFDISNILPINSAAPVESDDTFASISRITKDETTGSVVLRATTVQDISQIVQDLDIVPAGTPLAYYYPEDVEPSYRRIVLSKDAANVRITFRKSSMRVRAMTDLIPLSSRAAITCMMRSFEYYRSKEPNGMQMAKAAEDKAVALLMDEQKTRNIFAQFTDKEIHPIIGLNVNNRDSIIVSDIYDEASDIVGMVGRGGVFDKITNAVEMLSRKGQWDGNGLEGYVDITSVSGIVTLPRYVDYVLAINFGNSPTQMRNRWFEFHLNGPGSECSQSCRAWTDMGDVITLADLTEAQGLIYKTDSASDDDKTIRVYGYDADDKWIITDGVDGFPIVGGSTKAFADITAQKVKRIERITREATVGFAQLIAFNSTGVIDTQLGYYYPDETEPNYRRIKIPSSTCCWVRLRYRKRQLLVKSLTDPLHLHSRQAILTMLRAVEAMGGDKLNLQLADALEKKAVAYLSEEKTNRTPGETFHLQFNRATSMSSPEHGQY